MKPYRFVRLRIFSVRSVLHEIVFRNGAPFVINTPTVATIARFIATVVNFIGRRPLLCIIIYPS